MLIRSENARNNSHIPSTLARRALRHELETLSPTVKSYVRDSSQHVAASTAKPNAQVIGCGSVRRKRRSIAHNCASRKQTQPSALSHDRPLSGICDDGQAGIRTRRMSAADACNNHKSADLVATGNAEVDRCSRLSSASTAPADSLPSEVTGIAFFVSLSLANTVKLHFLCSMTRDALLSYVA